MMTDASTALQQADVGFAELVLSRRTEMTGLQMSQRRLKLLVLQAPVATDLRIVVTVMRAVGDLERMAKLAGHVAKIA